MSKCTNVFKSRGQPRVLAALTLLLLFPHPVLRGADPRPLTRPAAQAAFPGGCLEANLRWEVDCPKRAYTITGITDGVKPGLKRVEFTWHFTTLSEAVAKRTEFTTGDHRGTAFFLLYDDGWRFQMTQDFTNSLNARGGSNTRPFAPQPPSLVSEEIREDVCNVLSFAAEAYYVDFNSFYLVDSMHAKDSHQATSLDDRRDGPRALKLVKTALSPLYIRVFPERDPYDNPYVFEIRENGAEIQMRSLGSDGKAGGNDDTVCTTRGGGQVSCPVIPKGATFKKCR